MKFNEDAFSAKGIVWTRTGNLMRFMLPAFDAAVEAFVGDDGTLDLVPMRSHKHRALAALFKVDGDG